MRRRMLLAATAALALAAPAGAGAATAPERCGGPVIAGGQPALVVVVADGIGSQELQSGTSDPLTVPNWCPALPDGGERHYPAGIEVGLRTWAGLATPDGAKPLTQTCRPAGGLSTDTCLVARLADAGAIVLPYSYAGARVTRTADGASRFAFPAYMPQTTYQDPAVSVAQMDGLLRSIQTAWPSTRILVVAHSYGGTVASGWWLQHAPDDLGAVAHVFTLDSPVNGIEQCALSAAVFSASVSQEFCRRWDDRDAFDARLLALDAPRQTLTTIGTPDDPAYEEPFTAHGFQASGGGLLRTQVVYRCPDAGTDGRSGCIAVPPSVVNNDPQCAGRGPGIQGRTGHFTVIACPQTTRTILAAAAIDAVLAPTPGARGAVRPATLRVGHLRARRVTWTSWGHDPARGTALVGGHRRPVVLTGLRPCDDVGRFAYRTVRIAGRRVVRGCPRGLVSPGQ